MARKNVRARTAARKMKDKWKGKEWYKLIAPEMFNSAVIGETLADEADKIVGRTAQVTVQDLTGDFSKMHIKMTFKVDEVNGFNAHTKFVEQSLTSDYVRRLVRRKRSKMDAVFDVRTKDGYVVRIKPMAISDGRIQTSQKVIIRQIIQQETANFATAHTLSELLKNVIDNNLQKNMTKACKSVYPLRKIEIRKSEILVEPADKPKLKKDKVVEAQEEGEEPTEEVSEAAPVNEDAVKALTEIPGVGPSKAKVLVEAGFNSVDDIKNAAPEDLEKAEGVGPALAKKIHEAATGM